MAITKTGDLVDSITTNGDFLVGNTGVGGLAVDGGSKFVISTTSVPAMPAGQEPLLDVGSAAGSSGTVTLTGAGSEIDVVSTGTVTNGATVRIGFTGTGVMNITAGRR